MLLLFRVGVVLNVTDAVVQHSTPPGSRRRNQYARDLEMQIREQEERKKRERDLEMGRFPGRQTASAPSRLTALFVVRTALRVLFSFESTTPSTDHVPLLCRHRSGSTGQNRLSTDLHPGAAQTREERLNRRIQKNDYAQDLGGVVPSVPPTPFIT